MTGKRIAATCVSGVLALTLGFGMVGCGGNNQQAESTAQTQQAEKKEEKKSEQQVLGTKKDGAQELKMKNGLSSALTAVSLRVSGEQTYQSNLVASGKKVATSEEVLLYVDGVKADANYDIRVTKESGGDVEFLAVPVSKIASLTLKEADGKAYVDYVGTDKQNGSTKDAAAAAGTTAAAAAGAAAAGAAAASDSSQAAQDTSAGGAQSQESAPAATDNSSDNGYVTEQYYESDGYDSGGYSGGGESYVTYEAPAQTYEAPAQTYEAPAPAPAPSAPAQTQDSCVPDLVLR